MPRFPFVCVMMLSLLTMPLVGFAQTARETAASPQATAQEGEPNPAKPATRRPRIGVALEGGGALGLAHIGVLQWFEEHHIPVDYVAGTSMGGLVGGFYATGMAPADLRKLIENVDWREVLSDRTPYEDLSFRRKEDQRNYPNALVLGLRNGITLPLGLNAGHQIGLLIDRETLPYFALASFDGLPVAFRCVATDLVSGKEFVFKDGSLAEALRATMSIPGAFTPVHDKDRVYVDGGLVNNLPTDVARDMGAEIVIAVHLETAPVKAENIESLVSVLEQSVHAVISENEARGLAHADAVVSVDLGSFGMRDFTGSKAIMESGYQAAEKKAKLLANFSLSDAEWEKYTKERDARKQTEAPVPQFIQVRGTDAQAAEDIQRYLAAFIGKPLDPKKLDSTLTLLTGGGRYDTVGYQIGTQGDKAGLVIQVQQKNLTIPTVHPAFEVDGSEAGDVEFTLATRLTLLDVAGFRSEWRTDVRFGNTYGIASELYRPFAAASRWFVAPHADTSDEAFPVYAKNDPLADYRFYRSNVGGDIGYGFNRFSELRVGYEVGSLSTKLRLGTPQFAAVDGRVGDARMRFVVDHTDDPVIPRRGYGVESNFRWYDTYPGERDAFPSMEMRLRYFQPVSRAASVFVVAEGGTTFGFANMGLPQFFLGGPGRLSAYGYNELHGNQYYLLRAGYLHELVTLPPLLGRKVYAVGSYEAAKMYGATNESKFPNDFAAGVLAETTLGPFFVGGSAGDTSHHKWFFQLGHVF